MDELSSVPGKAIWLLPVLIALAGASLWWGVGQALIDSADLWRRVEEVELFGDRLDPYTDPDLTYPPSALPVFTVLLAPVDPRVIPAYWVAWNLVSATILTFGLRSVWGRRWDWMILVLAGCWILAAKPTRAGIALGQFHLLPTALAVLTIPCLVSGRKLLAGLLLGLALCKPTMVVPLLFLWMIQGQARAVATALMTQAALWLASSAWLNQSPWELGREWIANTRGQEAAGSLDLPSLIARLPSGDQISPLAITLLALLLATLVSGCCRKASLPSLTAFALVTACLFVYHRHYDLVLLLPPIVALAESPSSLGVRGPRVWFRASAFAMAALLVIPTHPAFIRPFVPLIEPVTAVSAYALWVCLAIRCAIEHRTRQGDHGGVRTHHQCETPGTRVPHPGREAVWAARDVQAMNVGRSAPAVADGA